MNRFFLHRISDPTGNSGTGRVAEGCCFSDGSCVVRWTNTVLDVNSTVVYASIGDAIKVHGHGGSTEIEWVDGLQIGDFVDLSVIDGFGGTGRIVEEREAEGSRWRVQMDPPHSQIIWAHNFEILAFVHAERCAALARAAK